MSTNFENEKGAGPNIAQIIAANAPGMSVPALQQTLDQVESVKSVRFAFNWWMSMPNFGSDGFRFNIPYPELTRLTPIPLPVFERAVIIPRTSGQTFALMSHTLGGSIPSQSSKSEVKTALQMPAESMKELSTAYFDRGMTELQSMLAHDEQTLIGSFLLYEAVMAPAVTEEELDLGRRPGKLVLEEYPNWLRTDAPRVLRVSISKGFHTRGQQVKLPKSMGKRGEQLIEELLDGILRAHEKALNPSDGILPRTKELLNITANKGAGGKTFMDRQDHWLLAEFPGFRMDTDVERASETLKQALLESSGKSGDVSAIVPVLEQLQHSVAMLTKLVADREKASA